MNVLIISSSDLEGGAARATYRLHQGLQKAQVASSLLVQTKQSRDLTVIGTPHSSGVGKIHHGLRLTLESLLTKVYPNRQNAVFSSQWLPEQVNRKVQALKPDLVNLHWTQGGYVQVESLAKLAKPIVWTLHDMWAFTGGCHYDQHCSRYTNTCGQCPQLGSTRDWDLSRLNWHRKARAWKGLDLTIVTPSQWLAQCARSSALLKNHRVLCIPNGIDTSAYRPIDRSIARDILHLPQNKNLILAGSLNGSSDKRKGSHLLQLSLQELSKSSWRDQAEIVIFGETQSSESPDLGLKTHYLGMLNDDQSLSLAYSAADVFVAPSLQDNLPNTIMESIACGTPCVGFDIGGIPDMIDHQQNGFLAEPYKVHSLAQGIVWILESEKRLAHLSQSARNKAIHQFTLQLQATRYLDLFNEILEQRNCTPLPFFLNRGIHAQKNQQRLNI